MRRWKCVCVGGGRLDPGGVGVGAPAIKCSGQKVPNCWTTMGLFFSVCLTAEGSEKTAKRQRGEETKTPTLRRTERK